MAKRRVTSREREIAEALLFDIKMTPSQVREILISQKEQLGLTDVPSVRTITRWKTARDDDSQEWVWTEADPDEAAVVLDTLYRVLEFTEGRVRSFTVKQARFIYLIRRTFEDLEPVAAYLLATQIDEDTGRGDQIDEVSGYLVYRPWSNPEHLSAYRRAAKKGWIPGDPKLAVRLNDDGTVEVIDFIDYVLADQQKAQ